MKLPKYHSRMCQRQERQRSPRKTYARDQKVKKYGQPLPSFKHRPPFPRQLERFIAFKAKVLEVCKAHQPLLRELLSDHELLLEVQVRLVLVGLLPEVVAGVLRLSERHGGDRNKTTRRQDGRTIERGRSGWRCRGKPRAGRSISCGGIRGDATGCSIHGFSRVPSLAPLVER